MAVPGHIREENTTLSLSAVLVLSQPDTAVMFESIGPGSQRTPALCIAPSSGKNWLLSDQLQHFIARLSWAQHCPSPNLFPYL